MRISNIVFGNLRAEMGRKNIGICELADAINLNRDTLSRRLSNKSPLNLDDAFKIQKTVFPEFEVKYLFAHNFDDLNNHRAEHDTLP